LSKTYQGQCEQTGNNPHLRKVDKNVIAIVQSFSTVFAHTGGSVTLV